MHQCRAGMHQVSRRAFFNGVLLSKAYRPRAHRQSIRRGGALQVTALRFSFHRNREVEHQQVKCFWENCPARSPHPPHLGHSGSPKMADQSCQVSASLMLVEGALHRPGFAENRVLSDTSSVAI